MKAKRRVCALLFSALMIWQGFMIVNAEGALDAGVNGGEEPGTKNAPATPGSGGPTTQDGSGSGPTAPGAPDRAGFAQQNSGIAGAGDDTAPESADPNGPSETASSPAAGGTVQSQRLYGIIRNAKIYLDGNDPVPLDKQVINRTTNLQFKAELHFGEETPHAGDYTEIELPQELIHYTTDFVIKEPGGEVVANGKYYKDKDKDIIRITFTDKIGKGYNPEGYFFFKMKMNKDKAKETNDYNLNITDGKNTLTSRKVHYDATFEENPKTFFKDTVRTDDKEIQKIKVKGEDRYLVQYEVTFDAAHFGTPGKDYKKVEFTDELVSSALSYFDPANKQPELSVPDAKKYQPRMQKGVWRTVNYEEGQSGVVAKVAPDDKENRGDYWSLRDKDTDGKEPGWKDLEPSYYVEKGVKKFKVNLGDIGKDEGVVLIYYAEIVGEFPRRGVSYTNKASLKSESGGLDTTLKPDHTFIINEAGGLVYEKPFKIEVYKKGEDGTPLQGAIFKLSSEKGKWDRYLTTNEHGEAVINNAIPNNYELVEIQAPDGYQKGEKTYKITKDDFNTAANNIEDKGAIVINVTNRKTPNPPPTPNNPPTPGNPPTPNTPPTPGTPPTTPPTLGQVLGARRYPEGQGGSEQEKPAVLGTRRGRGSADTSDHSASDIHWLLFGFGTAGLFAICINELVGLEKLLHRRKSRR